VAPSPGEWKQDGDRGQGAPEIVTPGEVPTLRGGREVVLHQGEGHQDDDESNVQRHRADCVSPIHRISGWYPRMLRDIALAHRRTLASTTKAMTTLWTLCTMMPIQALRYRFVGYDRISASSSVDRITHGVWRW